MITLLFLVVLAISFLVDRVLWLDELAKTTRAGRAINRLFEFGVILFCGFCALWVLARIIW